MEDAKVEGSPAEVAEKIAESHARAVVFPKLEFAEKAPVGDIAQRMVDGTFDKAFLISEIERFTGVKVDIPDNPGKVLAVIPEHGYWSSELTLTDRVFRAAGYEVEFATPRGERPFVYGVSTDTTFKDQAWNAAQVSPGEAALGGLYNDPSTEDGQRLNSPRSLDAWLPPTPGPTTRRSRASRSARSWPRACGTPATMPPSSSSAARARTWTSAGTRRFAR